MISDQPWDSFQPEGKVCNRKCRNVCNNANTWWWLILFQECCCRWLDHIRERRSALTLWRHSASPTFQWFPQKTVCVWVGGWKENKKPDSRRGVWVREKGGAPTPAKTRPLFLLLGSRVRGGLAKAMSRRRFTNQSSSGCSPVNTCFWFRLSTRLFECLILLGYCIKLSYRF